MLISFKRTLCAAACLFLPLACGEEQPSEPVSRTPMVQVVDFAGFETFIARHKGRPYLLNFWAIW